MWMRPCINSAIPESLRQRSRQLQMMIRRKSPPPYSQLPERTAHLCERRLLTVSFLKTLLKVFLAGITAVAILCGVFSLYLVTPVHIPSTKGNTDYVWPANSRWVTMREGISWGRYDADGFNNPEVIENPDILILGSSHMEATNVLQEETVAVRLGGLLEGDYTVYNMGISGHHFLKVCKYLPATLSLYENSPKAIVIETSTTYFPSGELEDFFEGNVDFTPSHNTGITAALQKLPFFRLLYRQIEDGLLGLFLFGEPSAAPAAPEPAQIDPDAYDALFRYIDSVIGPSGTQLIIFYHPSEEILPNGSVVFRPDETTALFAEKCEAYGITFVDMTQRFSDMSRDSHAVPHGFATGELGWGHLNSYGHEAIAQALADTIRELEEAGKLCR